MSGCAGLATAVDGSGQEPAGRQRLRRRRVLLHHAPRPGPLASPHEAGQAECRAAAFPSSPTRWRDRAGLGTALSAFLGELGCPLTLWASSSPASLSPLSPATERVAPIGGERVPSRLGCWSPCPVYGGQGPTPSVRSCWSSAQDHMDPPWREGPGSSQGVPWCPRNCREPSTQTPVSGALPGRQWPLKILFTKRFWRLFISLS